jgi:hypothetical protein
MVFLENQEVSAMKSKIGLVTLLLAAGLCRTATLRADLVSHWTFDGTLADEEPLANDGIFTGDIAPLYADGYDQTLSGAIQFDGVDDYVEATQNGGLPIFLQPAYSVAVWVKALPQLDRRVYSESSSVNNAPLFTIGTQNLGTTGQVDIFIRNDANTVVVAHRLSAGTAFDDTWHHLAWVDDNGQAVLYIDGVQDPTDFSYVKPVLTIDTTNFGAVVRASRAPPPCCWLLGAIDDLRVYDHALTAQEVADLVRKDTCPPAGDTHCGSLVVTAPAENRPGMYTLTAAATDDSADAISYTFTADNGAGTTLQVGPQPLDTATFNLTEGTWTLSAAADDDPLCGDQAPDATCTAQATVVCPAAGDTHCGGSLLAIGPPGNLPGTYTFDVENAVDDSGEAILYTFRAENGTDPAQVVGPLMGISTGLFTLEAGTWTITATVDDDQVCPDQALDASCSTSVTVTKGPPALVSRWTLDETLEDAEPSANHGTFVGDVAPFFVDGFDGTPAGALSLDGLDDYADLLQNRNLPIYAQRSYSIALWVNGGPQLDNRVYSEGSSLSNTPLFNIGTDNTGGTGSVDLFIRGNNNAAVLNHVHSQRVAFDNTWHHIAWVDDGGRTALYIDGIRDATDFDYRRPALTADRTSLGAVERALAGNFFLGMLDEARVYNYALSEAEVQALVPEPPGCPAQGDTHCGSLTVEGPPGGLAGTYTLTAPGATDDTADPILYTFTAVSALGKHVQAGPQPEDTAQLELRGGTWTISVTVDDDLACRDRAGNAVCSTQVTVLSAPPILISHWKFDGDLLDAQPSANHGIFTGEPAPIFVEDRTGAPGSAVRFDGLDDHMLAGGSLAQGIPVFNLDAYSIAMWVKGGPQPDRRIYSESSSTNVNPLFTLGTQQAGVTGQVDIFVRTDAGTTIVNHALSAGIAFDDTWHHVAWVDEGGLAVLYIDGVRDATEFSYAKPVLPVDTTTLGAVVRDSRVPPPCCWLNGAIDDARVYNYALTEEEIQAIMDSGPVEPTFRRGDGDGRAAINISDPIYVLNNLFAGGPAIPCPDAADGDDSGALNITDPIRVLNFLFAGGPAPPPPGNVNCGVDPTPDALPPCSYEC